MSHVIVSIIILNYNGLEDTKACLRSISKTTYKFFNVIVVDNGSKINEAKQLQILFSKYKKIRYVRFNKNYGFTGGNNKILKKIHTPYVVLLNNDTIVTPSWLTNLVKTMKRDKTIVAVQPKILWLKNKKYFDYAGATGGFIDFLGYSFTRGRIFTTIEKDKGQYNKPTEIFWASGAAMIIKSDVFKKIGLFDQRFFNYMEEIDLCYRLHTLGIKIFSEPKSVVFHKVASTASRNSIQKRFWEHRNNLLFIVKNFPLYKLFYVLPIRLCLEILSVFYYIFTKRGDYAYAVLLSLCSCFYLIPLYMYKRSTKKSFVNSYPQRVIYPRSIIFDYFILKKKHFSQLPFFLYET